ncbi:nuclease-related domain-containing protein [Blastococcus sp. DSM 46786]|uniref:nuclease-related domain-containing protein n=1 Tax=Blastococcus sp. DSM 46786 TaxID=1798227 RepID=UPI00147DB6F5|nr:nuclease-related domain-containing protein [Blastococcus sp. DSM 46786]
MTLGTTRTTTARLAGGARLVDALRVVSVAAAQLHSWAATTEGRRRTGMVLRSLDRAEWQVTRLVRLPGGGQADHLVIGPTGAYLLDSRAWGGVVTVDHKGATITPGGRPETAWTARGQHCSLAPAAAALGRTVSTTGRRSVAPRAVVVVWATFPERLAVAGGITYVAGDHLVEWLSDRSRHSDRQVALTGRHVLPSRCATSSDR